MLGLGIWQKKEANLHIPPLHQRKQIKFLTAPQGPRNCKPVVLILARSRRRLSLFVPCFKYDGLPVMVSTHVEGGFWMGWDLHAATLVFHQRVYTRVCI